MDQATGQKILKLTEVTVNNFFTLGSGIYLTLNYGILLDFEETKPYFIENSSHLKINIPHMIINYIGRKKE